MYNYETFLPSSLATSDGDGDADADARPTAAVLPELRTGTHTATNAFFGCFGISPCVCDDSLLRNFKIIHAQRYKKK